MSALYVSAGEHGFGDGGMLVGRETVAVRLPEVVHCSAVAGHDALEVPLVAQNLLQQSGVAATRLAVKTLVGTHHFLDVALLYQHFESRQIGLPEVSWRQVFEVEAVSVPFRSAVYGKMLGTGIEFLVAMA